MNSYPARNRRMRPITSARISTAAIATPHTRIVAQLGSLRGSMDRVAGELIPKSATGRLRLPS